MPSTSTRSEGKAGREHPVADQTEEGRPRTVAVGLLIVGDELVRPGVNDLVGLGDLSFECAPRSASHPPRVPWAFGRGGILMKG